jgi:hypothetical protein
VEHYLEEDIAELVPEFIHIAFIEGIEGFVALFEQVFP